jgi:hypothetical protein
MKADCFRNLVAAEPEELVEGDDELPPCDHKRRVAKDEVELVNFRLPICVNLNFFFVACSVASVSLW